MPAKRKASKAAAGQTDGKQAKKEDQKSVQKKITIPVDEGFDKSGSAKVHIGDDGTIYDASLNQTNVGQNNNKFYRLQMLEDGGQFWCHTRWGRLGEFGQKKITGPGDFDEMKADFDKKFKDKTGLKWDDRGNDPKPKKYTYLERNYEDDDEDDADNDADDGVKKEEEEDAEPEPESKLDPQLRSLVELIFNERNLSQSLEQMGYNAEKLPLGKLGKNTLLKGFECLQALEDVIKDANLAQSKHDMTQREAIEHFTNRYYSNIPHVGFNKRATLPLIDSLDLVKNEVDMLDNLSNMAATNQIMQETRKKKKQAEKDQVARVDQQFAQLKLDEATPLDKKDDEYKNLENYLVNTAGYTHNLKYKIHGIFRIDRNGEGTRFKDAYGEHEKTCRRLLWHGSRTSNYGGILSQGLRIAPPEAPVSGYMFGKGIYLADISTKSANYCFGGGGVHNLIMVCEAELGNPVLELRDSDYNAGKRCQDEGFISTKGMGKTVPKGWVDAKLINENLEGILMPDPSQKPDTDGGPKGSYLQYNEYIVYDVAQVRIRYLIRFEDSY